MKKLLILLTVFIAVMVFSSVAYSDTPASSGTGFVEVGGEWYYQKDGTVQSDLTDIIKGKAYNQTAWWYIEKGKVTITETVAKNKTGWWYVKNGKIDFGFTGFADNNTGRWRIESGKLNNKYTDVVKDGGLWRYYSSGKWQKDTTSVVRQSNGTWWYAKDGIIQTKHTGVVLRVDTNSWWYVSGGKVIFGFTGFADSEDGRWRIEGGKCILSFEGVAMDEGELRFYRDGRWQSDFTGTYSSECVQYTVENGIVTNTADGHTPGSAVEENVVPATTEADGSYDSVVYCTVCGAELSRKKTVIPQIILPETTLTKDAETGKWYYTVDGTPDLSFTGFFDYGNGRWRIENGVFNNKYTDVVKDDGSWRYYKDGKWQSALTTIVKSQSGSWWYIVNGVVRTSFTGVVKYAEMGSWWYVKGGKVQFDVTGIVKSEDTGSWWYVSGGKVCLDYTGLAKRADSDTYWYVEGGKVVLSYNGVVLGTAFEKFSYWRVSCGKVIEECDEIKGKTINLVNLRKGPGTDYDRVKGSDYINIPQNTTIDINDSSYADSTPWYKTSYKHDGKTYTGWVSGKYVLLLATDAYDEKSTQVVSATGKVTGDSVNFRTGPSTSFTSQKTLSKGTVLSIYGAQTAADGTIWYRAVSDGTVGYISKKYVSLTTSFSSPVDEEFEKKLAEQGFPETYRKLLRQLHAKYPNWNFIADKVSDTWGLHVQSQYVFGSMLPSTWGGTKAVSIIDKSSSAAWKSMDPEAYDSSTGKWVTNWDGSNWAIASKAAVRYYLDPRNFINETDIFQFLDLSYDASQTAACVTAAAGRIGAGWLGQVYDHSYSGPYNGKTIEYVNDLDDKGNVIDTPVNYPETLAEAGKAAGMNPIALICIITQELGTEKSATTGRPQICGKVSSYNKNYADLDGYYNYFNIGAYVGTYAGTSYNTAYGRGLAVAKNTYDWDTREKAINGGAKYFADKYVKANQQTVYYKRFNVVNGSNQHQFSTDIQGASGEGRLLSKAYSESLRTGTNLTFRIPVYSDMTASPCMMPVD